MTAAVARDQFDAVFGAGRGGPPPPKVRARIIAADHPYLLDSPDLWLPAAYGIEYRRSPAPGDAVAVDLDTDGVDIAPLRAANPGARQLEATVEFVNEPALLRQPDGSAVEATPAEAPIDLIVGDQPWTLPARQLLLPPAAAGPRYLQPELPQPLPVGTVVCLLPEDLRSRRLERSWAVAPLRIHTPPLAHHTHLVTCAEHDGVYPACLPEEPITIIHELEPSQLGEPELGEPGVVSVKALGFPLVAITGEPGGRLPLWH